MLVHNICLIKSNNITKILQADLHATRSIQGKLSNIYRRKIFKKIMSCVRNISRGLLVTFKKKFKKTNLKVRHVLFRITSYFSYYFLLLHIISYYFIILRIISDFILFPIILHYFIISHIISYYFMFKISDYFSLFLLFRTILYYCLLFRTISYFYIILYYFILFRIISYYFISLPII